MDTSFELLSSMSPKINRNKSNPPQKTPTILALKKYIRRSSAINVQSPRINESIITIESTSTSTVNSSSSKESPLLISSDNSEAHLVYDNKLLSYNSPLKKEVNKVRKKDQNSTGHQLSQEKFSKIKNWVHEVNKAKKNTSMFSEVSTGRDEDNASFKAFATDIVRNSTFSNAASPSFNDLFNKNLLNKKRKTVEKLLENSNIVVNDSLITEDNLENNHSDLMREISALTENCNKMVVDDSFKIDIKLKESLTTGTEKRQLPVNTEFETTPNKDVANLDEYEDLLDGIYGNSWRQSKDILPLSEPKFKRKETKTNKKVNTEKPTKAVHFRKNSHIVDASETDVLLKTSQKTQFKNVPQSPWMNSIKNICDSDTDPESSDNCNLIPTKLNFVENVDDLIDQKISSELISVSINEAQTKGNKVVKVNSSTKADKINNEAKTRSFLASLSGSVPASESDVSALIYRKNFKQHREQLAGKLFELYNQNIFDNAVPSDTPLEWNDRMRGTAGYCYCRKITRKTGAVQRAVRIVISSKVVDSADRLRDTLVHEMCHAVTWIVNQVADGHGSFWRSWADRAMKIFPELPPIKRCHQYVINTKYTYRCVNCGYSVGRHTKSLDVERKRCGYCYGKFEVLINKTTRKGETKTVPVTPKKAPTGFALFVKENYATYKTPELKHAEVMKMLGQKFSNLKVDQS